jgi:hypothetical protein
MARNNSRDRRPTDEEIDRIPGREPAFVPFDPAEESLTQFRTKVGTGEGAIVKIYRRTPGGMQYCFQGPPSEIDEEMIRVHHAKQIYAGENGVYYARAFRNGEPFGDSIPINIAPQIGTPVPETNGNGGMAHNGNGANAQLVAALDRITQRLENVERQEREPLSSLADAMVKLQGLQRPQETPIDQALKFIELGKTLASGGGGTDSDSWMPMIKELLPAVAPALQGLAVAYMRNKATENGQPGPPVAGSEPVQIMSDDQKLFAAIQYLKAKCLKGSDPGLYADLIWNDRDEPDNAKLIHRIATQKFEKFVELDDEIGRPPFVAWFRVIYDGLGSLIAEQNKMATAPGGESGNQGNAESHGKTGKGGTKKR